MEERNSNYEIEKSRTGLPVPVINGVYLHSIYNPQKEAQALAENYSDLLKTKNAILILGLGFGYHVNEIASLVRKNFDQYQIIVIEPNTKLVEEFVQHSAFDDENIKIINVSKASRLYHNQEFVQFLMRKPCVIKHEASFSINKEFFTSFLSFKAETKISDYQSLLNDTAKKVIEPNTNDTFSNHVKQIMAKRSLDSKQEFLTMALNSIINR